MLTEGGVRRLVKRICAEIDPGSPPPDVVFNDDYFSDHKNWAGSYSRKRKIITIPSAQWIKRHKATTEMGYRELVLHEVTHHLFDANHSADFFCNLFSLCELYGVPLAFAYEDERSSRIRNVMNGLNKYVGSLRSRIDELSTTGGTL